ncbi:MAG: hypothetical protein AAGD07_17980, partial [Planctomycetota bacterium]
EDETQIRITSDPLSNNAPTVIAKSEIEQQQLADLSPMPAGLLNSLDPIQVLDLLAYIESGGKPGHAAFDP